MANTIDCTTLEKTPLALGSKGEVVKTLQTQLKEWGYYTTKNGHYLKLDGDFGTYTADAVKKFQGDTGHSKDGVFGPKTCSSYNQKLGVVTTTTTTTSSSSSSSATTRKAPVVKVDPYKVDVTKNVFSIAESNLDIDGLYFPSNISADTPYRNGNVKHLELMEGFKSYIGHSQQLAWTAEIYLSDENFKKLNIEFYKMQNRRCNVRSKELVSGNYAITVTYAKATGSWKKVTMKLVEWGDN